MRDHRNLWILGTAIHLAKNSWGGEFPEFGGSSPKRCVNKTLQHHLHQYWLGWREPFTGVASSQCPELTESTCRTTILTTNSIQMLVNVKEVKQLWGVKAAVRG